MKFDLLPCPFCGCNDLEGSPWPTGRDGTYIVRCGDPRCSAEVMGHSERDVVRRWNRREPKFVAAAARLLARSKKKD